MTMALLSMITTLYFGNFGRFNSEHTFLASIIVVLVSDLIIVAAFVRYFHLQYPSVFERLKQFFKRGNGKQKTPPPPVIQVSSSSGDEYREMSHLADHLRQLNTNPESQEVTFTEYREPLMDEGELDIATSRIFCGH